MLLPNKTPFFDFRDSPLVTKTLARLFFSQQTCLETFSRATSIQGEIGGKRVIYVIFMRLLQNSSVITTIDGNSSFAGFKLVVPGTFPQKSLVNCLVSGWPTTRSLKLGQIWGNIFPGVIYFLEFGLFGEKVRYTPLWSANLYCQNLNLQYTLETLPHQLNHLLPPSVMPLTHLCGKRGN